MQGDLILIFNFNKETGMKKSAVLFMAIGLCVFFGLCGPAGAIKVGGEIYFKVKAAGPVSVATGQNLSLTLEIENNTGISQTIYSIQAVVIDPFTGTRVFGPQTFLVGDAVAPGAVITETISLGPINNKDRTLSAIITIQDPGRNVRGVTGWGFVTF
jgi:hypothetical protein